MKDNSSQLEKSLLNISFIFNLDTNRFDHFSDEFNFTNEPVDNLLPELIYSWIYPDDQIVAKNSYEDLIEGTFKGSVELRVLYNDDIKWIRITPFLSTTESERFITGTVTDITGEMNNFQSVLRFANKKNSILNMLAHDLRGPLESANSMAMLLKKQMSDPVSIKMTDNMSSILSQAIVMIRDLLDRELFETVGVELVKKRIDIAVKVDEYLEEARRSEQTANRIFNFSSSHKNIYMELDEMKFMQIMNNLMTNSLKFTQPGGIISIHIEDQGETVLFTFSDNGIGIPQEFHPTLFEKFSNARRKGLNGEPSIGLGLSIVDTIIKWHKGQIWFESKEEEGTIFRFELPKQD